MHSKDIALIHTHKPSTIFRPLFIRLIASLLDLSYINKSQLETFELSNLNPHSTA